MKKIVSLVLAVALVLSCVAMAFADENVIKIGVYEPASGDNGAGGKQETLGVEYANAVKPTVTVNGVEYKVELVEVDNQSVTDKAITAAQSLVSDGVAIVLGSYGSGVSIAAGDLFAEASIPAIGLSCTNPNVTALCDYYWRICFLDPFQGTVMANFAKDQFDAKKAYVLAMLGEDYGVGLATYYTKACEALGIEVVSETFPEGTSDFSAYLNNAASNGCDVIFSPCSATYASLLINQANAQGIKIPMTAGDTWDISVVLDAAKGTNVDVYCSTFFIAGEDMTAAASEFVTGFQAWLNANPEKLTNNGGNDIIAAVSALGYDGYNVALAAIEAAGSVNSADIAAALPAVVYENAVTGAISFDAVGDAVKDMAFIKYANTETGDFDFVKTQTIGE